MDNPQTYDLLFKTLAKYWYDRKEDDDLILEQFLNEMDTETLQTILKQLNDLIDGPMPMEAKINTIKEYAWKYFPTDEAMIDWLNGLREKIVECTNTQNQSM